MNVKTITRFNAIISKSDKQQVFNEQERLRNNIYNTSALSLNNYMNITRTSNIINNFH